MGRSKCLPIGCKKLPVGFGLEKKGLLSVV
jgi:hypothetical protein